MAENTLKSLDQLFGKDIKRIYRIPEYQRGYSWETTQLAELWDDLENINQLPHYTGVLTIKEVEKQDIKEDEFFLANHNYRVYEIVDGQQRMTSIIILLKSIIDFAARNFEGKNDKIILSDIDIDCDIDSVKKKYLYFIDTQNKKHFYFFNRSDDASYKFFKHKILEESDSGELEETSYTNNLENAKKYFDRILKEKYESCNDKTNGEICIKKIFDKLTSKIQLQEFIIPNGFDVNVAFEAMNNRGKRLSNLELLKNRLLYLSTLLSSNDNERKISTSNIKEKWGNIYKNIGIDKNHRLTDDDYLKEHWTIYFSYNRTTGNAYRDFLLSKKFVRNNILLSVNDSTLDFINPDESNEYDDIEEINYEEDTQDENPNGVTLKEIDDYVSSLGAFSSYWISTYYPRKGYNYPEKIIEHIESLNIVGMRHFRPLVAILLKQYYELNDLDKNVSRIDEIISLLEKIERFIFTAFYLNLKTSSYTSYEFYTLARELNYKKKTISDIKEKIDEFEKDFIQDNGYIKISPCLEKIKNLFLKNDGYYTWRTFAQYVLYKYELKLCTDLSRQMYIKELFEPLAKDKISIEHIYPQKDTNPYWQDRFGQFNDIEKNYFKGALGNLLLLESRINKKLQNDSFDDKKERKIGENGEKLRSGYKDGSLSEKEVAENPEWKPENINSRSEDLFKTIFNDVLKLNIAPNDLEKLIDPRKI